MVLPQRKLLISALAGAALAAVPRLPRARTPIALPNDAANRRFSIFYKGDRVPGFRDRFLRFGFFGRGAGILSG